MILHKCNKSGCNALISIKYKYCKKHVNYYSRQYDRIRMNREATRNYRKFYQSKAWKNLRSLKLARNPLCERCLKNNIYSLATDVHHIKDVYNNYSYRLNCNNLQALCKPCHEKIHKLGYYPPL